MGVDGLWHVDLGEDSPLEFAPILVVKAGLMNEFSTTVDSRVTRLEALIDCPRPDDKILDVIHSFERYKKPTNKSDVPSSLVFLGRLLTS